MKIWNNYKWIINKAEEFPQLKYEVREIKEMIGNWYNIKNNIIKLKEKVEKIINW